MKRIAGASGTGPSIPSRPIFLDSQWKAPGAAFLYQPPGYFAPDHPVEPRKLLITGCPRSGTRFTTEVLKKSGLRVNHEAMGPDGLVSCFFTVNDFWYPGGHIGRRDQFDFEHVWHQIRHPLKVIASMSADHGMPGDFRHWQEKHTGIPGDYEPRILRWANFWRHWVPLATKQAQWTYRIEDFDGVWTEMRKRLEIEDEPDLSKISRAMGSKRPDSLSWDDLEKLDRHVAYQVRRLAEQYGYE